MSSMVAGTGRAAELAVVCVCVCVCVCVRARVRTEARSVPAPSHRPYGLGDGGLPRGPEQTCSWTEAGLKSDSESQ